MTASTPAIDQLTLNLSYDVHVRATLEATFEAVLEQMGPGNETPDGRSLPMTLEPWPGGRWFRDLGDRDGHFWAVVQAIKRPALLELSGPLFMSSPVLSNIQYRLTPLDGGTRIAFRHSAFGFVPDEHRDGLSRGWTPLLDRIRRRAESGAPTRTHGGRS